MTTKAKLVPYSTLMFAQGQPHVIKRSILSSLVVAMSEVTPHEDPTLYDAGYRTKFVVKNGTTLYAIEPIDQLHGYVNGGYR